MRSFLTSTLFAASLAAGTVAIAQEATDSGASEFDIGQSLAPAVGELYIREEIGDWAVRCEVAPEGQNDPCNLYQLLINDAGVSVAEVNIFRLPEGSEVPAGATIVVPLETFLPAQLTLDVDGQNARRYPYRFCNRAGCIARIGLTPEEVDEMKRGANGTLRIVPAVQTDSEVVLNISLSGFTAAYDAITSVIAE